MSAKQRYQESIHRIDGELSCLGASGTIELLYCKDRTRLLSPIIHVNLSRDQWALTLEQIRVKPWGGCII